MLLGALSTLRDRCRSDHGPKVRLECHKLAVALVTTIQLA